MQIKKFKWESVKNVFEVDVRTPCSKVNFQLWKKKIEVEVYRKFGKWFSCLYQKLHTVFP